MPVPPNTFFPRQTNPGRTLTSEFLGGESDTIREIPPEFRAALDLTVLEIPLPWDVPPIQLSDTVLASKAEQKVTAERMRRTTYKPPGQKLLVEHFTDKYKQFGIRNRTFKTEGDAILTPTVTRDVNTKNLGNFHFIEDDEDTLTLFTEELWKVSIPDPLPKEFAVLVPITEHSYVLPEVVSMPTLTTGELEHESQQVNVFVGRETSRYRTIPPGGAQLVSYRMTKDKQIETITATLDVGLQSLTGLINELTIEAEIENLGNNTSLKRIGTVTSLFTALESSKEVPDLVPEIFKAVLPTYTEGFDIAGTVVDPPIFSPGDFYKTEKQLDVYTKRITTRGRAGLTYPQSVIASRLIGGEQFGGEVLQLTGYLNNIEPPVETGIGVVSSEVKNLGNGTFFRQTEKWDTAVQWPLLVGTEVDPRTGIIVGITRQVVAAGTTGGVSGGTYTDVKPLDKWRSIQIRSSLDPSSLPAPRTWETTVEHQFPNTLNGLTWVWAAASGTLSYAFDSALVLDMTQGYAGPCRALVTETFSIGPPTATVAITQFFPQGHMIGYAWSLAVATSTECDTCTDETRAFARTWPVPPSLHAALTIGGGVTLVGGTITNVLPATVPTALPASGTLITKSVEVEPWRFGVFYRKMTQIYVP